MADVNATPQNKLLGGLAQYLMALRYIGDKVPLPQVMGGGLGSLLLGKSPEEMENWSYGDSPLQAPGGIQSSFFKSPERESQALDLDIASIFPLLSGLRASIVPREASENAIRRSISAKIGSPPAVKERGFPSDYARPGLPGEKLTETIDGDPLTAPYVAGRRTVGGVDTGLSAVDVDRVANSYGINTVAAPKTGEMLKGDAGRYVRSGDNRFIYLANSLDGQTRDRVQAHELSHAIEDLVYGKKIPTQGLSKELRAVYEDLNTGTWFKRGKGATPEGGGYSGEDVDRELMAEAIRAYMTDPNYLKTIAPKTAARIREFANKNPNINRVLQFNQIVPATIGASAGGDQNGD